MAQLIEKYFPELTDEQKRRFDALLELYPEWNEKINVISRKDIENLEERHILHSLAIAKFLKFTDGSRVLDLGTGGGFPGIPLAILFPDVHFHLIDRTGKKIKVATEVAKAIGLANVSFQHGDVAECKETFDFVVSRAVMPQKDLIKMARKNISKTQRNGIPNGIIALKGGNLGTELQGIADMSESIGIDLYFNEPFFDTKKIIYTTIL